MTEFVLPYDPSIAPQQKPWDCGPASTQIVLNSRGIIESEDSLIRDIGTTTNGTDDVSWVEHSMDRHGFSYSSVYVPDRPSAQDKEVFWGHAVSSINGGLGVVCNIVVAPGNYPRGMKGSRNPAYGGGTIWHYTAAMGYDDNPALRCLWIADPGFRPYGYWVSLDQWITCIAGKGYCYADSVVAARQLLIPGVADLYA